ncbi:MAG: hypothetical protein ACXW0T_08840 [Methylobacter sp.]
MTKQEAIELSGGMMKQLCFIVEKKPSTVSQWRDTLTNDQKLMVIGGLVVNGMEIPHKYLIKNKP